MDIPMPQASGQDRPPQPVEELWGLIAFLFADLCLGDFAAGLFVVAVSSATPAVAFRAIPVPRHKPAPTFGGIE